MVLQHCLINIDIWRGSHQKNESTIKETYFKLRTVRLLINSRNRTPGRGRQLRIFCNKLRTASDRFVCSGSRAGLMLLDLFIWLCFRKIVSFRSFGALVKKRVDVSMSKVYKKPTSSWTGEGLASVLGGTVWHGDSTSWKLTQTIYNVLI